MKMTEWKCEMSSRVIFKGSFHSFSLLKVEHIPTNILYLAKAPLNKTYYKNLKQLEEECRGTTKIQFRFI